MKRVLVIVVSVLIALAFCFLSIRTQKTNAPSVSTEVEEVIGSRIQIGGTEIAVEIAETSKERNKGLSDREALEEGKGMLFVFDTPGKYGFWMKDMNFPLDIIWINAEKKIVGIEHDVTPDTYPKSFTPQTDILYVLEVPAGFSQRRNIEVGEMFFSL